MSELVAEAVKLSLVEDTIDKAALFERRKESSLAFDNVLKKLKADGKI
jgi:hypothetical protein